MKPVVIAMDIDNTLNDAHVRVKRCHAAGTNPYTGTETMKDLPLPGAADALHALIEMGHLIIYTTARHWASAKYDSERWLEEHGFPRGVNILTFESARAKMHFLEGELKPHVVVDDFSGSHETRPAYSVVRHNLIAILQTPKVVIFRGCWATAMEEIERSILSLNA